MLTAILNSDKVFAEDMQDRTLDYKDEIGQKMLLVKGDVYIHHFRHLPGEFSKYSTEPETKEHLMGKKMIYNKYKKQYPLTDVEVIFEDISRRGDVVIPETKENWEVQCSPISIEEMEEREKDWNGIEYSVVWVFYKEYIRKNVEYRLTKSQLEQLENCGLVLFFNEDGVFQCEFEPVLRQEYNPFEKRWYDGHKELKTTKKLTSIEPIIDNNWASKYFK